MVIYLFKKNKMKAFKYIAFLLLIAIIGTSIYISVQPNSFEVSRTRTIKAPAAVIYNNVIDFKNWQDWMVWLEATQVSSTTFTNQTEGMGGHFSWVDKTGSNTINTTEAVTNDYIQQEMVSEKLPPSEIEWHFKQKPNGDTDVTWKLSAKNLPFGFKAKTILNGGINKQIGTDYEQSLATLERVIIADMAKYSITVNGTTNHSGSYYLYNTAFCKIDELESKIKEMLPKVIQYAQKNRITLAGKPFINYIKWDHENNAVIFASCVPTAEQVITAEGDAVITGNFNSFKAIKTTLKGNYSHIPEAWKKAKDYVPKNGFEFSENGPMMETYLNSPANTPNPAHLITELYIAIKDTLQY